MTSKDEKTRNALDRDSIPALKDNDFVYLNSGGSGPYPDWVRDSMRAADDLCSGPAYLEGGAFYARCAEANERARESLAALVGAAPEDIALTQNTSQGMSFGAAAMDWNAGDEVVTTTTEHPGCLVPLHSLAKRYGVKIKFVEPEITTGEIAAEMTDRTRLIALSHVDWTTGEVAPLEEITALARERGALTLVDGAQSVGAMSVDLPATGADMYAFTGHKWLLGPEGIGGFYVRSGLGEEDGLRSTNLGGASVSDPYSFDIEGNYALKSGAGRFEASTMSPALAGGIAAAAEAATARGEEGYAEIRRKADLLSSLLSKDPRVTIYSPRPARNGLVSFEIDGLPAKEAVQKLLDRKFVLRFLPAPRHYLRASAHLFVADEELEALAGEISRL